MNGQRSGFRPDVQGLRAVAVLAVIADHLAHWPTGGFVGVDVFFVISGYLITGLLLREHARTGTISFRDFYVRRVKRISRDGLILDATALEECVRANFPDMTFAEAYQKTKRVLNITVSSSGGGVPSLLNYLTAPNVLIWSAALVSNIPDPLQSPTPLHCKDEAGEVVPWSAQETTFRPWTQVKYSSDREGPLARIAELFNVNHFVVSQARPYVAPFLRSDLSSPKPRYAGRSGVAA